MQNKIVIGKDNYGNELYEGDICSYDITVDNIKKTLVGIIVYHDGDYAYCLNSDDAYYPSLYMHVVENIKKMA